MVQGSTVTFQIPTIIRRDYGGSGEVEILGERSSLASTGRGSVGSVPLDWSPRGSAGSLSNAERFEIMTRNSLPPIIQNRRQSTASAFINEPLEAKNDDNNWSWSYLRERFKVKDLEDLFVHYQLRLHHAMLIMYLLLQLFLSSSFIVALLLSHHTINELKPELTVHAATFSVCMALLVCIYNESTFRQFPKLHIIMSGLVILTMFTSDVALTLYFSQNKEATGDAHRDVKFGNMVYVLVVVYVFLPIITKWLVILLAVFLSIGYLVMAYYAIGLPRAQTGHDDYVVTKMCVDAVILLCVNFVGLYWRFMSEVAFRRAFLDKRGNLESKFKLDTEKKQEEALLLSILPKELMHRVKSDFRNMIETISTKAAHPNPVTKNNPFPNLYVNRHDQVTILYADIVNFTPLTTKLSVNLLVEMLNDLFGKFDDAVEVNNCLRIKILGDCYYCVSGVPEFTRDHANNCVKAGLEMIDIIRVVREERAVNVDMRIGIHSGSVLSGLIGVRKWQYDVWSNDVTIANHMEQTGKAGRIHVTNKTKELLSGLDYGFEASDGRNKDQLLQAERIDTYLIIPKERPRDKRKVSYSYQSASIKPRVSIAVDYNELKNLYEGDMARKITKVHLPQGAARGSILARRRSTHTENAMSMKRRTVVTDSALASFQRIMFNSKEFMEKAIESMPLRKYDQWFKPEGINPLFLTFTKEKWELPLLRQPDPLFKYYILSALVIFSAIFITQEVLMPQNDWGWVSGVCCWILLVAVAPLCWVYSVYKQVVDPHNDTERKIESEPKVVAFFHKTSKLFISSIWLRAIVFFVLSVALYASSVINVIECTNLMTEEDFFSTASHLFNATSTSESPMPPKLPPLCCDPWYFTYSCTLMILVAWTFFRLQFLIKLLVYVIAVSVYGFFVLYYAQDLFTHEGLTQVCPPLTVTSVGLSPGQCHFVYVFMVFLALHCMDRQMEYIMRLDFKWKQKLEEEQGEAQTTHFINKLLLENILPKHVAEMYLNRQLVTDDLYHETYQNACVVFASIPNYGEFYRMNEMNDEGKQCLTVLNEIISDFDMLTYEPEFDPIEKIKVVGSTYMAACGLQPGRRNSDDSDSFKERDKSENVNTIARFVVTMFRKLETINQEVLQDFKLRIGIDVGPVIAGVVGAHKPMYDIWGNTVNVASRMDYTGEMGKIHVTAGVADILREQGWKVECRGDIYVKGKGLMTTYFVDPDSVPPSAAKIPGSLTNLNNNNNNVKGDKDSGERRRSSQLSVSSILNLLSTHRGSVDISKGKEKDKDSDSQGSASLSFYRSLKSGIEKLTHLVENMDSHPPGASPRGSIELKAIDLQGQRMQLPSPVVEESDEFQQTVLSSSERKQSKFSKTVKNGDSIYSSEKINQSNISDITIKDTSNNRTTVDISAIEIHATDSANTSSNPIATAPRVKIKTCNSLEDNSVSSSRSQKPLRETKSQSNSLSTIQVEIQPMNVVEDLETRPVHHTVNIDFDEEVDVHL